MIFKTATVAAALAALLTIPAGAAPALAPGRPAGIHRAQLGTDMLIPMGISLGAVVAIVAATSDAGSLPTPPAVVTASATSG